MWFSKKSTSSFETLALEIISSSTLVLILYLDNERFVIDWERHCLETNQSWKLGKIFLGSWKIGVVVIGADKFQWKEERSSLQFALVVTVWKAAKQGKALLKSSDNSSLIIGIIKGWIPTHEGLKHIGNIGRFKALIE